MCGRFTLHTPETRIREAFAVVSEPVGLQPRYNIAPSQDIPIIRAGDDGPRLSLARWGLVPHWSKQSETRYSTINARVESVADKPAYRSPFRHKRCLIPADGFYEWTPVDGNKQPHYMHMQDSDVFAFAGLWDHWEDDREQFDSCTILVGPANNVMQKVHQRMPVIVTASDYTRWLDTGTTDPQAIKPMLSSLPSANLSIDPVSTYVNSPAHDDVRCTLPADQN